MLETVKERLIYFIKSKNLNQKNFESLLGLSNGYVNNIRKSISSEVLQKICAEFPDLNRDWLIYGESPMLKSTTPSSFALPFLDIDASAGFSEIEASNGAMKLYSFPRCDAAMPVRGLSMEPNIHDGDIAAFVMLPSAASMRPDGIYIVQYDDGEGFTHITVKRAKQSPLGSGYIRLAADNPEYGFEDVPLAAISRVALVKFTITPISY